MFFFLILGVKFHILVDKYSKDYGIIEEKEKKKRKKREKKEKKREKREKKRKKRERLHHTF